MSEEETYVLHWDDPLVPEFQTWSQLREEADAIATRLNHIRDRCMEAIAQRGMRDHKGSQYLSLPFSVGSKGYSGIKRERRVSTKVDEEVAESICRAKGIYEECFPLIPTLDKEELYVQYQKGILTQEDMDYIFTQSESFSFKPLS